MCVCVCVCVCMCVCVAHTYTYTYVYMFYAQLAQGVVAPAIDVARAHDTARVSGPARNLGWVLGFKV